MKNKNVYLAPAIQVKKIAVENGFQMSIAILESLSEGQNIGF
jgi:hypothetical protein